jgi:pilus assembly protein CpaB
MSRSTRTVLVLALSLIVAGGASFLVFRQVQSIPVREVEVSNYQVAVAAKPLPMGSLLSPTDVKLVAWPQSSPVAGAYTRVEDVVNRGLTAPVVENEPLTATKVASPGSGAGLPPIITPGMRAISLKVDEVVGVAGFVVPGAKVDVVMTMNQQNQSVSRVVVSNLLVLAAGTKIDQEQARDGRPLPTTVVTVLVSPEDAERISLAGSVGKITLALRNPLDVEPTTTNGIRVASLMGAPEPPPPAAVRATPRPRPTAERPVAAASAPVPQVYTVETIRAAKRTAEVVR